MTDVGEPEAGFRSLLERNWLRAIEFLIAVCGLAFGVHAYVTRPRPDLTYTVHDSRVAVVRGGRSSRLSVLFDGQRVEGDVSAVQIALWNNGRGAIRSGAVLSPALVRTSPSARILEAKLLRVSRPEIGMVLDSSSLASGFVGVRWKILEQGDGGLLQLVYVGDEHVDVIASAVVEGQPQMTRSVGPDTGTFGFKEGIALSSAALLAIVMGIYNLRELGAQARKPEVREVLDAHELNQFVATMTPEVQALIRHGDARVSVTQVRSPFVGTWAYVQAGIFLLFGVALLGLMAYSVLTGKFTTPPPGF